MAERREKPTRRHLREARQQGLVPRSPLFGAVSALLAVCGALYLSSKSLTEGFRGLCVAAFRGAGQASEAEEALAVLHTGGDLLLWQLVPVLVVLFVAVAIAGLWQVGPLWSPARLIPDASRLSPRRKNKPPPGRGALDAGLRALLGLALLGVGAIAVEGLLRRASRSRWRTLDAALSGLADLGLDLLWQSAVVLVVFALCDLLLQRHRWRLDVQMTRAQRDRATRESRGDPITRRRRREQARRASSPTGIARIPGCALLITDGQSHAAGLQYRRGEDPTPLVIASGRGEAARRLLDAARQAGVPIHHDAPLALALTLLSPGVAVPSSLYEAVAAAILGIKDSRVSPPNP